jgi:hypothetical protein
MAARELIHFPFRVQLILRPRVPARIASPAGLGVSFLAESALLLLIPWFCGRFVGCTIRSLNEIGAYTNGQNTELICRQERVEVSCYYGLHRSGKEIGSGLKKNLHRNPRPQAEAAGTGIACASLGSSLVTS